MESARSSYKKAYKNMIFIVRISEELYLKRRKLLEFVHNATTGWEGRKRNETGGESSASQNKLYSDREYSPCRHRDGEKKKHTMLNTRTLIHMVHLSKQASQPPRLRSSQICTAPPLSQLEEAACSEWVAHCDQAGRQEGVKKGYFLARCGFIKELIYLGMWSLGD